MEAGDGLVQAVDVKVRQLVLELPEGGAGIAQDGGILQCVKGDGGDVVGHPPEIVPIDQVGFPVGGVVEMQTGAVRAFPADMLRDLVDVVHQPDGLPEGEGVHILQEEGLGAAVLQPEIDLVGFVDIAHLNGLKAQVGIRDPEGLANLMQFFVQLHCMFVLSQESAWRRCVQGRIPKHFTVKGKNCQ